MIGRVVSTKMSKTVVVLVETSKTHPLYKKTFKWSKRFLVDDPIGVKEGDIVNIEKIRPISKKKHWGITRKVGTDFVAIAKEQLKEAAAEVIAEVMPETAENPENQRASESDKSEISDTASTQSNSESSEKKLKRSRKKKVEDK